jgi:2'-5' RNA ligase
MEVSQALILTLTLDARSQIFFNAQRRRYFPPERNFLDAHLTLFHHLPGTREAEICTTLAARSAEQAPLALPVTGLMYLGRGVAYALDNPALRDLHRTLQAEWTADLTPQDRQGLRPHVTIQNKVDAIKARALHTQLTAEFEPFEATGTGLALWAYRNGPWEELASWTFGG